MKEICHQAFWDVLKEELESDPPSYERALILLEEIRDHVNLVFYYIF